MKGGAKCNTVIVMMMNGQGDVVRPRIPRAGGSMVHVEMYASVFSCWVISESFRSFAQRRGCARSFSNGSTGKSKSATEDPFQRSAPLLFAGNVVVAVPSSIADDQMVFMFPKEGAERTVRKQGVVLWRPNLSL
jgi:hypothetical protein